MALLGDIDILLANEAEIDALLGTQRPDDIAEKIDAYDVLAAVTFGADGAHLFDNSARAHVPAQKLAAEDIVDLTGAGDQFAAGFLAGLHQGKAMEAAAQMGIDAASAVIRHIGPRPPLGLKGVKFCAARRGQCDGRRLCAKSNRRAPASAKYSRSNSSN